MHSALKKVPAQQREVLLALLDELELVTRVTTKEHTHLKNDLRQLQSKYETLHRENNNLSVEVILQKEELYAKNKTLAAC